MGKRSGRGRRVSIPPVPPAYQNPQRVLVIALISLVVILVIIGFSLFREGKVAGNRSTVISIR